MDYFSDTLGMVGWILDAVGVVVVFVGALVSSLRYLKNLSDGLPSPYRLFRQDLSRSILLSLEFLVAGDIIRTVVVDPTLERVAALGGIVLIRTFLSFSLQLEIDGRWPWQSGSSPPPPPSAPASQEQPVR